MNAILKTGLSLIVLTLLFACEKTIDFKGDNIDPKIVVNANLVAGQPISVQIMKSRSLLSANTFFESLPDAKALLYEDGVLLETLDTVLVSYSTNNGEVLKYFGGYGGKTIPQPGKTYRLEVSNEGLEPVSCETTMPETVEISRIDTITEYTVSEGNQYPRPRLKITLHFSDPAAKENYYRIESSMTVGIIKNNNQHYPGQPFIPSDTVVVSKPGNQWVELLDPVFKSDDQANEVIFGSPDNRFSIFNDALIDGKDYGLTMFDYNSYYIFDQRGLKYGNFNLQKISLISLSKEYYDYLHSVNYHSWYSDDFFSEPYPVLSNVKGGMGIFGSSNISTAEILLGEYPMEGKTYVAWESYGGYGY